MDRQLRGCAGLDVHKQTIAVWGRVPRVGASGRAKSSPLSGEKAIEFPRFSGGGERGQKEIILTT